jgi:hypothetical protein
VEALLSLKDSTMHDQYPLTRPMLHWPLHVRLAARLLAPRLDRQLATGVVGPIGGLLDHHAMRLESERERREIAGVLMRSLLQARAGSRASGHPCILVNRHNLIAAEALIDDIVCRLLMQPRVHARGMARLRALIADGRGPFYEVGSGDLDGRLRAARAAL